MKIKKLTFIGLFCCIALFSIISCNNTQNTTLSQNKFDEISHTLSNYIKHRGFSKSETQDFIQELCDTTNRIYHPVFFKYPDKINGYNIEGVFYIGADSSTDYWDEIGTKVMAILYFSSDSLTFEILHPVFQPYPDNIPSGIKTFDCLELSYNEPNFPDPKKISLDSISELPFAFIDIDFDGIKELLFSNPGNGQKFISTYIAYKYPYDETIDPFEGYTWNQLDEWTEFDYENQTVISSLWGGYNGCEKWYFRYDGNKLKPYLKEEYTHWFDSLKISTPINSDKSVK